MVFCSDWLLIWSFASSTLTQLFLGVPRYLTISPETGHRLRTVSPQTLMESVASDTQPPRVVGVVSVAGGARASAVAPPGAVPAPAGATVPQSPRIKLVITTPGAGAGMGAGDGVPTTPARPAPAVNPLGSPGGGAADPVHDLPPELLQAGWRRFWSRRESMPYYFNKVGSCRLKAGSCPTTSTR